MGTRAGITTDLARRQREWRQRYPLMYNWQAFGPFSTRSAAQDWENQQWGADRHGGGNDRDLLGLRWYGYIFNY